MLQQAPVGLYVGKAFSVSEYHEMRITHRHKRAFKEFSAGFKHASRLGVCPRHKLSGHIKARLKHIYGYAVNLLSADMQVQSFYS